MAVENVPVRKCPDYLSVQPNYHYNHQAAAVLVASCEKHLDA